MAFKEKIDDLKLENLIRASDNGEEWAQREYGRIFDAYDMDPKFIERVCRARINIYKVPAEHGDKNAILRYAHALAYLGYKREAYDWYMSLIQKGDADAMLALSEQYNKYGSLGHDPGEEMRWLKLAADSGNAEAQNRMGLECLCESDRYNALFWYELSARQNNAEGKIGYADCLQDQLSALDEYSKGWNEVVPGRYNYIKKTYGQLSPQECDAVKKDLYSKIESLYFYGIEHCNSDSYLSKAYFGLERLYHFPQGVCNPSLYLAAYYDYEHYLVLNNDFAYNRCLETIKENNLKVTKSDLQEWDEIGVYEWAKKHGINIFAKDDSKAEPSSVNNTQNKNTEPESTMKTPSDNGYDSYPSERLIEYADNGDDAALLEICFRYVVAMVKMRDKVDFSGNLSAVKSVRNKLTKHLAELKKGNIVFLNDEASKVNIDLSWQNAKGYIKLPIENIDDKSKKEIIDVGRKNGLLFYNSKKNLDAAKAYIGVLSYNPFLVDEWTTLGKIYREMGYSSRAIYCYNKALKINPNFGKAYAGISVAYMVLNELQKAEDCCKKAISLIDKGCGDYAVALANFAVVEAKLGKMNAARNLLDDAKKAGYQYWEITEKLISEEKPKKKRSAGDIALIILEWFLIIEGIGCIACGSGPIGLIFVIPGIILLVWDNNRKKKRKS